MPERPRPSAVRVMAAPGAILSPSEQEAVASLPETLRQLMQPRAKPATAAPPVQEPGA